MSRPDSDPKSPKKKSRPESQVQVGGGALDVADARFRASSAFQGGGKGGQSVDPTLSLPASISTSISSNRHIRLCAPSW
jgi:hypothetical protein